MSTKIITEANYVDHPKEKGVYLKHFFASADNDRLNNVEIRIEPDCQIAPHVHPTSTEFFYLVEGSADFFIDGQWHPVTKGCATKAPQGEEHGIRNTGSGPLLVFSTFSPPNR